MNLRKNLGRVASTIVATALLASVATVPAFAATTNQIQTSTDGNALTSITIEKELDKPANAYAPKYTFDFTVAPAGTGEDGSLQAETAGGMMGETAIQLEVYKGITNGVTKGTNDGKASFEPAATDIGQTLLTEEFTFTVNSTAFPHAGVYKYTITESASDYDGITNDNVTTRDLYVYVRDDNGTMEVYGAVVKGQNADKTDRFTNTYLGGGTDSDMNEVAIEKAVTGEMGSKENQFAFSLVISGPDGEKYKAEYQKLEGNDWTTDTSKGTNGIIEITSKTPFTGMTLADSERLYIYGLSDEDVYTIIETDAEQDNYTTSVTGNVTGEDTYTEMEGQGDSAVYDKVVGSVNPDTSEVKTIKYTNNRDAVSPTGIAMNVAPYALLVVVAVAGCFVFLRKRNED